MLILLIVLFLIGQASANVYSFRRLRFPISATNATP